MKSRDWYEQRESFYLGFNRTWRGGVYVLLLLGLAGLAGGMALGEYSRTWGSYFFSLFFFFSLALGGAAFGSMQDVIGATWGRPIKRLHETFSVFLPLGAVFMVLYLVAIKFDVLGARQIYKWIADPVMLDHMHGKKTWLQLDFMLARDIFALVAICLLAKWHVGKTLRRDTLLAAGKFEDAQRIGRKDQETLRYWSAPVLVGYALCYSLLCFDLSMSLAPTWFSTLWAGWHFSITMQTLFAFLLVMMFFLKDSPVGYYFQRQQFHDIGKLMHGFTVFFAYLTYSHVLTYWYTNIPEETSFFLARLQKPWLYLVLILPLFNFVIPLFALIPKVSKWFSVITVPIAVLILVAQWFTYLLVVMPEVAPVESLYVPWVELASGCFFLGCFLLLFFTRAGKIPMIAFADPLLPAAIKSEHH